MFILSTILIRLLILPFLYVATFFMFWDSFGVWTSLFAIIPMLALVGVFSNPVLVYISSLLCTFICLHVKEIPLYVVYYDSVFLGIQFFLLSVAIFYSIYKSHKIPRVKKKASRFYSDKIIVTFDPILHTIKSISSNACKFYGWKRRDIINKTLGLIYTEDIFDNPPEGFWEALKNHQQWCGVIDVITKNGTVFEEVAFYTAILDKNKDVILIEKKVLELFIKDITPTTHHWYQQFYEDSPDSLAIINKNYRIESANPSFIKEFQPILKHTVLQNIFHKGIVDDIKRVLKGEQVSILDENSNSTLIFNPYYCSKRHNISHILLRVKKESQSQKDNISKILKKSLTSWYADYKYSEVKLFSKIKYDFVVPIDEYMDLMKILYEYVEQHAWSKNISISCNRIDSKCYFSIYFEGEDFSERENLKYAMLPLFNQIKKISSKYGFAEGSKGKLLLVIEFS